MEKTVIQKYTAPLSNSSWLKIHNFLLKWNSQRQFEVNTVQFSDTEFKSYLSFAFWFAFLFPWSEQNVLKIYNSVPQKCIFLGIPYPVFFFPKFAVLSFPNAAVPQLHLIILNSMTKKKKKAEEKKNYLQK